MGTLQQGPSSFFTIFVWQKNLPDQMISEFQHSKCMDITNKLIAWPICGPFIQMVDPERDGCSDYFDVIKKPMALCEVKRKLTKNIYNSVDEWKKDVNLIWENAKKFNGDDTLFTYMAMEASLWFNSKMKEFPMTEEEYFARKIEKLSKQLVNVISHPPKKLDPNGVLLKYFNQGEADMSKADMNSS